MKVLAPGAPRTGTTSLGNALAILGFTVHKGIWHAFAEKNHLPDITRVVRAKLQGHPVSKEDLDPIFGQYDAVHGFMITILADELLTAYPDAKVILTTRDPDSWVTSWNGSVMYFFRQWSSVWWQRWAWVISGGVYRDFKDFRDVAIPAWSYGNPYDRAEQRTLYLDHNQHIRGVVPKERLLEFRADQGWGPLCEFLDREIPKDVTYPHSTSRDAMNSGLSAMNRLVLRRAIVRVASALGLAALAICLLMRRDWIVWTLRTLRG